MKKIILKCGLYVLRAIMSFIYFFIKMFPVKKNKVLMLSRQSNEPNIDFKMLKLEILKYEPNTEIIILCKKNIEI